MATGLKVSAIARRGEVLPDAYSIDASYTGDDADWDGVPGEGTQDQWKQPVRVATTANVTIASALNAGDTIDGVTLAAGDRVLVKDQSTASQNGIYIAGTTPARAEDFDEDDEILGALVYVIAGTANAGKVFRVDLTAAPDVDTDDIDWAEFGGAGSFSGDAGDVPIVDSGGHFTGTDVEAALEELATEAVAIVFVFSGGGDDIPVGATVRLSVPFACTITGARVLGDASGDIEFDVLKADYSTFPTTSSIVASAPPALSTAQKSDDTTLTGWTTAVAAGDVLEAVVDSCSGIEDATLTLTATRT